MPACAEPGGVVRFEIDPPLSSCSGVLCNSIVFHCPLGLAVWRAVLILASTHSSIGRSSTLPSRSVVRSIVFAVFDVGPPTLPLVEHDSESDCSLSSFQLSKRTCGSGVVPAVRSSRPKPFRSPQVPRGTISVNRTTVQVDGLGRCPRLPDSPLRFPLIRCGVRLPTKNHARRAISRSRRFPKSPGLSPEFRRCPQKESETPPLIHGFIHRIHTGRCARSQVESAQSSSGTFEVWRENCGDNVGQAITHAGLDLTPRGFCQLGGEL